MPVYITTLNFEMDFIKDGQDFFMYSPVRFIPIYFNWNI